MEVKRNFWMQKWKLLLRNRLKVFQFLLLAIGFFLVGEVRAQVPGNRQPVVISIPYRALTTANGNYKQLILEFNGGGKRACPHAFRVFLLKPGQSPDYSTRSVQYAGSYAVGHDDCHERFLLDYPKKRNDMIIHIIPIDFRGREINIDLSKNFRYFLKP